MLRMRWWNGVAVLLAAGITALGQNAAFTYQGRLCHGGRPWDGSVDLRFTLFDQLTDGTPLAIAVEANSITVSDGLFSVLLDFGATEFGGGPRWIEIALRSPAGKASL